MPKALEPSGSATIRLTPSGAGETKAQTLNALSAAADADSGSRQSRSTEEQIACRHTSAVGCQIASNETPRPSAA